MDLTLEAVNEKNEAIKNKYWKLEWERMDEKEKMKDVMYSTMLYEMNENTYQFALQELEKAKGQPYEEHVQVIVDGLKKIKDWFNPVF